MTKKLLLAGVAAVTLGGATVSASNPAQAQVYFGTGYYGSPYYGGGWGGGYYPAQYYGGYSRVGYYPRHAYHGYPYYRRRSNTGAVAAGLIGGLALGAIAASAARPAYYYPATPVATACWVERRRGYDRWGRLVVTRTRVCG